MTALASLVIATHGVAGGPGVAAEHARALAEELPALSVAFGCVKGEPPIEEVVHRVPGPAVVVPLLMAEGFIFELLRERLSAVAHLRIAPPIGTRPELAALVADAAAARARREGWEARESLLLLVGHGTPRHPRSGATAEALAQRLHGTPGFAAVEVAFLEQSPRLAERLPALARRRVVTVGLFVDAGPHGKDDVEEILARAPGPVVYTGPIGRLAAMRGLIRACAGIAPAFRRRDRAAADRATAARREPGLLPSFGRDPPAAARSRRFR
ncbi:MAG: CbiX/SirB N-terminal domain-containing protein [Geminicoccaceae bacterium]|nr:CbiX/SirB N-terminal domain-containing protein [Geminicoccaceae bacterium]